MLAQLPGASRHLARRLAPHVRCAAQTAGADRYRKHFPALAHLWLLLLHVLLGSSSQRQTHALLSPCPCGLARLGLRRWISFSQLARSSTSRPAACLERLLADLVAQARPRAVPDPLRRVLARSQVRDSPFLRLSARLSPWSQHGQAVPGVRVQTGLALAGQLPTHLHLTLADTNDHDALRQDDPAALRGWTVTLDLGYYGHRQFQRLRAAGVSFLTRLHPQAGYRVSAQRPIAPSATLEGDVVLADETITLGSPHNRRGAVVPHLRLVTSRNRVGVVHRFLTDRHDLTAAEVVMLYRKRWHIELFFRWLKHHLGARRPLGHSRAAVWLTLLVAAIVAVLAFLLDDTRPPAVSRIAWLRAFGFTLLVFLTGDG